MVGFLNGRQDRISHNCSCVWSPLTFKTIFHVKPIFTSAQGPTVKGYIKAIPAFYYKNTGTLYSPIFWYFKLNASGDFLNATMKTATKPGTNAWTKRWWIHNYFQTREGILFIASLSIYATHNKIYYIRYSERPVFLGISSNNVHGRNSIFNFLDQIDQIIRSFVFIAITSVLWEKIL